MDVVIPAPDTLKIVSHRQYDPPESLFPSALSPSALDQFRKWYLEVQGKVDEPEAMSLATATPAGVPSTRLVLLKELDSRGFVFFTNYTSRKSRELAANPHAALAFYWREMHRQVRVVGRVEKVSKAESEEYFASRPVGSRLGAWASEQSTVVQEDEVRQKLEEVMQRFNANEKSENAQIPLPEFWGGWRIIPESVLHSTRWALN
jgi:pyridoxamine-phosphate oxidase